MSRLRALRATAQGQVVAGAYAAGWSLVRRLPEGTAHAIFRAGADAAWRRQGKGTLRLRSNLARVLGPGTTAERLDEVTRDALRSYARYWLEVFRLPVIPRQRIHDRMETIDLDRIAQAHSAGRGVILALPHIGNWDQAGTFLTGIGFPFTTVAERLEPAELFDRFVAFRESLGMEVLPLTGGTRTPFEVLQERLRAGGVLCLLADRDLSATGVPVRFFGATATMPAGPAALCLATGATLLPTTLWFTDGPEPGWGARIHPAVPHTDIATMTQVMADAFAEGISAHPQDWHMLQRLWRDDLDATTLARQDKPVDVLGQAVPAGSMPPATPGARGMTKT